MTPLPDLSIYPMWRSRRDGPGWRHGLLLVLVDDVVDSWRVAVSILNGDTPNDVAMERVRRAFGLGDAVEETPIADARFLVFPKLPESYPWDTTGAVFHRDDTESPWRLHSLFTGDAKHYDVHDAGWNSASEANLYALSGGGGGLPYLGKLTPAYAGSGLEAVWSRHGWCDGGKLGQVPADPVEFGYLVLEDLPDIALEECGTLQWCETCEEVQDFSEPGSSCEHVWHCRTAEQRIGATGEDDVPRPCADEYCECNGREATQRLYSVPLLWSQWRRW